MNQLYRITHMGIRKLVKKIVGFDEIYTIGYRPYDKDGHILENNQGVFRVLPFNKNYWYADPIIFDYNDKSYLFMEAYDRKKRKGHIAYGVFNEIGELSEPKMIIREKYHMSFPMVFFWEKDIYMIPETSENKSINIYKCLRFPESWELLKSFNVSCELVDPIIVEQTKSRVRVLFSEINNKNPFEVRYKGYFIEKKENDFFINPDEEYNAKQSFTLETRNAGRLFSCGNSLIQPTQVSTNVDYGVFLKFLKFKSIEKEDNGEIELKTIKTEDVSFEGLKMKNLIGVHTYCCDKRFEVIDVRYFKYTPQKYLWELKNRMRNN